MINKTIQNYLWTRKLLLQRYGWPHNQSEKETLEASVTTPLPSSKSSSPTGSYWRESSKTVIKMLNCSSQQLMVSGRVELGKNSVIFKGLATGSFYHAPLSILAAQIGLGVCLLGVWHKGVGGMAQRLGRNGKWVWLVCIVQNSQIIIKDTMLKGKKEKERKKCVLHKIYPQMNTLFTHPSWQN